ncbi:MAG: DnaD domain protein [Suilimivivens sp.]
MSRFTIYQDNYSDTTIVSNLFIDEYMKDANDAQLKIYLYLLRMMSAHMATSISDIADKFNHTEKDVMRALKYWEKNKLLSLEYDEAKNVSGIRLLNVDSKPCADIVPLTPVVAMPIKEAVDREKPSDAEKNALSSAYEKPSYTLDELREFKSNEETAQILFVAEQYIGKPLSPNEIKTILFFSDKLGFSSDLIDYLIQYCVDKGKKDFRYIEKVAISWAQEGITTPKQAAKYAHKYDKIVYDIMKALGKSSAPTKTEADYVTKWIKEYGFTSDIIMEACERTVLATDRHRFEYADSILKSWYKGNVHHKADIKAMDEAYSKKRMTKSVPSTSQFNQFMHTNYDFDALEKEILSN